LTVRLFVYGTLAPGGEAWPRLGPWVVGAPVADAVAGRLYDTGRGYPAATFTAGGEVPGDFPADDDLPEGGGFVHGTLVTLDPERSAEALAALDRYEGREYERIVVTTKTGVEAATYAWIAPLADCLRLPEGRWTDGPARRNSPA